MEPLTFAERIKALEALISLMEIADRMAEMGYHARALEMYEDLNGLHSLYRERVA